jgi:DNA polymerase-3 subunit delta
VSQAESAFIEVLVSEADRAFNLVILDGSGADWADVVAHLRTLPMFGDRKVVVVRDARLAGAGSSAANLFNRAREAWAEGGESRRKTAVGHLMNLLGAAAWPLEALGKSGPDARSADNWRKELKVTINDDDLAWLEESRAFAAARGMAPKHEDRGDPLVEYLKEADSKTSVLILTAVDVDKRLSIYKTIEKVGKAIELTVKRGEKAQRAALKNEIDQILASSGKKLNSDAFIRLERKTGFDLRKFVLELTKIITYVGDRKEIRDEDVDAVVPQTREESIFELADAIGLRNAAKALKVLTNLIDQDHHPLEILGSIHREIRNLYLATDYVRGSLKRVYEPGMFYPSFQKSVLPKIAEKKGLFSKLHPYVMFKALEHQENFDRIDLEKAFALLAAADLRLKSTRADPRFVLEEVVFKLCSAHRVRSTPP